MLARISYQAPPGPEHSCRVVVKDKEEKIQARWLYGRFYETQRHGLLNTVYKRFQGGTFIDIGATIGNHSLFFATCCGAAKVYAFEPVAELYEHLLENVRANDLHNIHAYNLALGSAHREVGMRPSNAPRARGGMMMSRVDERGHGVQMARLDDILAGEDVGDLRCIKIDVEGYNLPVLQGAVETIAKHHPAIFCECEYTEQFDAVNHFLSQMGYRVWKINRRPFVMNHTPTYLWEWMPTTDFAIVVTTYNRPQALAEMLQTLMADAGSRRILCRVYNDGSTLPYENLPAGNSTFRITYVNIPDNHGKRGYWRLINRIWQELRAIRATYYMQLPDDVEVQPGFFAHAAATYEAITDPKKISLNLYLDDSRIGKACWTRRLPRICKFGATTLFQTGWVDMIFMAEARFFEQLDYALRPISRQRWAGNPRLSSGVGQQISNRLRGFSFYQVRHSYLRSLETPSHMHPLRPEREDLSTTQLDPIVAGVASMPARAANLRRVVAAVLPFVDALHVYLNNYRRVPAFLAHPKIEVHRSQEHGDLGDAGKFFTVGQTQGYYLSLDDDLIYPESYVWTLVNALRGHRKSGRRVAVGLHGKIMRPHVRHFYRDHARYFHYAAALAQETSVHLLGTGTAAFHTADLPITIADFSGPRNAADIHFALACQQHDVGCIVLPRPAAYLQSQRLAHSTTIWRQYRNNDQVPTELFNRWQAWRIRP